MADFVFRNKSDLQLHGKKFIFPEKKRDKNENIEHTLILIHAFPFSSEMWVPNFKDPTLTQNLNDLALIIGTIQVILPDLPGFGQSESFMEQPKNLSPYVDVIHEIIMHFNSNEITIGGCSMGGYISLEYLHQHPRKANGLILVDSKASADTMEAKENRYKTMEMVRKSLVHWANREKDKLAHESLHQYRQFLDYLHRRIISDNTRNNLTSISSQISNIMHQQNPLAIMHALGGMAGRRDNTKIIQRTNIPVLILVGENDILTPPEIAQNLVKSLKNGTLRIIPKSGHLSNLENMRKFNEEFVTWYKQM